MNDGERRMADALADFGWTCGPDFWSRYYSDPWVFNLANAVEQLSIRLNAADSLLRSKSTKGDPS